MQAIKCPGSASASAPSEGQKETKRGDTCGRVDDAFRLVLAHRLAGEAVGDDLDVGAEAVSLRAVPGAVAAHHESSRVSAIASYGRCCEWSGVP
jgi:hypothetical protein